MLVNIFLPYLAVCRNFTLSSKSSCPVLLLCSSFSVLDLQGFPQVLHCRFSTCILHWQSLFQRPMICLVTVEHLLRQRILNLQSCVVISEAMSSCNVLALWTLRKTYAPLSRCDFAFLAPRAAVLCSPDRQGTKPSCCEAS